MPWALIRYVLYIPFRDALVKNEPKHRKNTVHAPIVRYYDIRDIMIL